MKPGLRSGSDAESQKPSSYVVVWMVQLKGLPLGKDGIPGSRHLEGGGQLGKPRTRHRVSRHLGKVVIEKTVMILS